ETNSMVFRLCLPVRVRSLPRSAGLFAPARATLRSPPAPCARSARAGCRSTLGLRWMPVLCRAFKIRQAHIDPYCFTKDTGTCTTAAPPEGAEKFAELARDLTHSTTESGKLPVLVAATLATCPVGPTLMLS